LRGKKVLEFTTTIEKDTLDPKRFYKKEIDLSKLSKHEQKKIKFLSK